MVRATRTIRLLRLAGLLLVLLTGGLARGYEPTAAGACRDDAKPAGCLTDLAVAAMAVLPAEDRVGVVATLLDVHLNQHLDPPAGLVALARQLARSGRPEARLQVLLPLAELAFRTPDRAAAKKMQRQVERLLAGLAARRQQPLTYLQIADACIGLTETQGGAPVFVAPWSRLYARYCKPAFFSRLQTNDGFARIVHSQLQVVGHYLVQDRAAFQAGLPAVVLSLRTVGASLDGASLPDEEREAGMIIAAAMEVSLGALACRFDLAAECRAVLLGAALPAAVETPALWSTWAAIVAVSGDGLAAGGHLDGARAALDWLLARADEADHQSHRAAFLASAAWLADRLESWRGGRPQRQAA